MWQKHLYFRVRKYLIVLFLFAAHTQALLAQLAGTPPNGPVSMSLGGVSSPIGNSWSIFNNPAGLTYLNGADAIFGYQTIFDYSPFNTVTAAVNYPTEFATASFGVYRFGDELFNSAMASLGLAKKIGIMSLGIKADYLQYNIDGFGKKAVFVAEMGGIATLTPHLTFGMHLYNFTQAVISDAKGEKVPVIIRLSMKYKAAENLALYLEGEKDIDLDADVKFGLAYAIIEALELRTGFSTTTNRMTFGAGFNVKQFTIDYGLRSNPSLGATHNFGLTYRFTR